MRLLARCNPSRSWSRLWCAVVPVLVLASPILASPPQPTLKRTMAPWLGYLVIVIMLAAVMGVSLIPSKRGHQD